MVEQSEVQLTKSGCLVFHNLQYLCLYRSYCPLHRLIFENFKIINYSTRGNPFKIRVPISKDVKIKTVLTKKLLRHRQLHFHCCGLKIREPGIKTVLAFAVFENPQSRQKRMAHRRILLKISMLRQCSISKSIKSENPLKILLVSKHHTR